MASYSKVMLSGGPGNGRPIKLTTDVSPGVLIHTTSAAPVLDEVFLWASNWVATDAYLVIGWGGATEPDDCYTYILPGFDTILVAGGMILSGGLAVRAWGGTNLVTIGGYVNRITP